MTVEELKVSQMTEIAKHRSYLMKSPRLRWLFFEITSRCNLNCVHCGSKCSRVGESLSTNDILNALNNIGDETPTICLTGGEPLLHPDFFEIASIINDRGLYWGMTTNATLIDKSIANKLYKVGLSTVSVSLDGLQKSHDEFRKSIGSWEQAVNGIINLKEAGFEPQVTTVVHQDNISEIEQLYEFLCKIGIKSWRPINLEPIGRACESGCHFLNPEQFTWLISYIYSKRFSQECDMEVTYGCSHFLGIENERMVRNHYFLCGAGILTASIRSNGDICACLDIENREDLVQGNIKNESFIDVWQNEFKEFRSDRTSRSARCKDCAERLLCVGDSVHTWDFSSDSPLFCYKDYILK